MNFNDFEAHVRRSMDDPVVDHVDTAATWKTDEIASYLNDALANYSQFFPRQRITSITVVAGTQTYALPEDIIQPPDSAIEMMRWKRFGVYYDHLKRVEFPSGSQENISFAGTGMGYWLWGNNIILCDEPTTQNALYTIELWYRALHQLVDVSATDALYNTELTVPQADRELLFWYVTACMMGKLEASDSDLRRWAQRDDAGIYRDDNPSRKSASWRMEQYDNGIAVRRGRGHGPRIVKR